MSFELHIDRAETNACARRDEIIECNDACKYVSQLRYGRESHKKHRALVWDLMRIWFYNNLIDQDNILGNEEGAVIADSRILVHGDSFGILITTS